MLLKKERQRKSALICAVKERGLRLGDVSDLDADQDDVQAVDTLGKDERLWVTYV